MLKLESRVGKVPRNEDQLFTFLTDFNNFRDLIPSDKVKNWESDKESCRFTVDGIGDAGFHLSEKEPNRSIKIRGEGGEAYRFMLWIQLKQVGEMDTRVKLTMEVDMNPVLALMVRGPIQRFLDMLIEAGEKFHF
jgi:carbon monoxide dehydrogenase subunit G